MSKDARAATQVSLINSVSAKRIRYTLPLPFYLVEPAVVLVDIILIIAASVLAGIGYHWLFLNRLTSAGSYAIIGALASLTLVTTLIALGAYRVITFSKCARQVCHVTFVWIAVFLFLLAIAFSLKATDTLSRGATVGFFAIGLFFLLGWRVLLAFLMVDAVANGRFAKQKAIFIGERPLLLASRAVPELQQYGYMPSAVLEISDNGCPASTLQNMLDRAIIVAREEAIEHVLLFISWEHTHCIEVILDALNVLPIRIHLVPDEKVSRSLLGGSEMR